MNQDPSFVNQNPAPTYSIPDEKQIVDDYLKSKLELDGYGKNRPRAQFVKFLGPLGEESWASLPVGTTSSFRIYILPSPSPKPGLQISGIFQEHRSHFFKSEQHPGGTSINCAGENCLVCQARRAGLASADPHVQSRAKRWGKTNIKYFYNVILLDFPQQHISQVDGVMRPMILQARRTLHNAIGELIQVRGLIRVVDPINGRPIMIKKTKTGEAEIDVEYTALDLDPMPLPQQFHPVLSNLYYLSEFCKPPTQDEQARAVTEMNLPLGNQAASVQPTKAKPFVPMTLAPAPVMPVMPIPSAQPWELPASQVPVQVFPTVGTASNPTYTMFPGQVTTPTPVSPTGSVGLQPHRLTQPVTEVLPGAREKCFGRPSDTDRWCIDCKRDHSWIYDQCVGVVNTQTSTKVGQPTSNPRLDKLQEELMAAANQK